MNTGLLGGVIFVLVFAGIILVHELGHFLVAKLMGVEVEEFGFGLPPRMLRLWRGKGTLYLGKHRLDIPRNFEFPFDSKTIGHRAVNVVATPRGSRLILRSIELAAPKDKVSSGTEREQQNKVVSSNKSNMHTAVYVIKPEDVTLTGNIKYVHPGTEFTLNWIPLGGFNKIKGEDDPAAAGGMAAANPWKRIAILVAGATMNLLTAVVVYTVFFSQVGVPDTHTAMIVSVEPTSPAELAGIKPGDILLAADGLHINGYERLAAITRAHLGQPLPLAILRNGQVLEITITPRAVYPADQGPMGVGIGQPLIPAQSWFQGIPAAFSATGSDINSLLALPGRIIAGTISSQEAQIAGPRTIWNVFQQAVSRDVSTRQSAGAGSSAQPTNYTLLTIISLTVTVAVANLLPIPALDGGRIFMLLPEIIFRRRIPIKFQMAVNGISFIIMLGLLGFFYIKDIINPVNITLP